MVHEDFFSVFEGLFSGVWSINVGLKQLQFLSFILNKVQRLKKIVLTTSQWVQEEWQN